MQNVSCASFLCERLFCITEKKSSRFALVLAGFFPPGLATVGGQIAGCWGSFSFFPAQSAQSMIE